MTDPWITSVEFHSSHHDFKKIPQNRTMPQVAFCGRSNAGKSSLINSILNKKDLVRTSSTPGKTRSLNFFLLNKKIFLVDLPGFGYAKASHTVRDDMIDAVNGYLNEVDTLKVLFILCDAARSVPDDEISLIETSFQKKIRPVLIRTKTDKLNQKEKSNLRREAEDLVTYYPDLTIVMASTKDKSGIQDLRDILKII